MPPLTNLKQLQSLQEKLQAIRRFIVQLSDKCKPFTKLLKKEVEYHWGKEKQDAFDEIQRYLLSPPMLSPPRKDIPFLLYIFATKIAIGTMLAQKNEHDKGQAIYYLSRTLVSYEIKYIYLEKLCLAIVFATKKL